MVYQGISCSRTMLTAMLTPHTHLTAAHCTLRRRDRFCVGTIPDDPSTCLRIERVINHDGNDIALVELREDATNSLSDIVSIPILTRDMDQTWIGETVEAAGYGQMENDEDGTRKFTAEKITELTSGLVTIYGEGERGVCFGDSGGPLMVIDADGTIRVVGVLSHGIPLNLSSGWPLLSGLRWPHRGRSVIRGGCPWTVKLGVPDRPFRRSSTLRWGFLGPFSIWSA